MTNKIAPEVAEAELDRFADLMDLDFDIETMEDDDKKSFLSNKKTLVKALMKGSLVIDDNGQPVFTPARSENKNPLTFREPTGASLQAMDKVPNKNADVSKIFALMATLTGADRTVFGKMVMTDLKVCQAVTAAFLG